MNPDRADARAPRGGLGFLEQAAPQHNGPCPAGVESSGSPLGMLRNCDGTHRIFGQPMGILAGERPPRRHLDTARHLPGLWSKPIGQLEESTRIIQKTASNTYREWLPGILLWGRNCGSAALQPLVQPFLTSSPAQAPLGVVVYSLKTSSGKPDLAGHRPVDVQ